MTDDDKAAEGAALVLPDGPKPEASVVMSTGSLPNPSPEAAKLVARDDAPVSDLKQQDAGEVAKANAAAPDIEPGMQHRAGALIAAYAHGMESNSPRTMAELNEMRALLLGS